MLSIVEENYIKSIYKLSDAGRIVVSTNSLASKLSIKAATATDMLKKLSDKLLINYQKYQGVSLSDTGLQVALKIIRKHRLWEMFLVEKLNFGWNEVHDIAEQLEHIHSDKLVIELERFLEFPLLDPHGEPIPSASLEILQDQRTALNHHHKGEILNVVGVLDDSTLFLSCLDGLGIDLDSKIEILDINEYDHNMKVNLNDHSQITISKQVAQKLLVKNFKS